MPTETERPQFLTELLAEIDNFDAELFKPNHPISSENEDTVIGTLSPWLRKLYALGRYYSRQIKLIAVERDYEDTESASEDMELCAMTYRHHLLNDMMWSAIREEYRLWTAPNVGIRVDWQVVTSKPEPSQDERMEQFLNMLMGRKKK